MSGLSLKLCEVDDPKLDAPLFITILVTGAGIPQPSGYVLDFGLPGASAAIGSPHSDCGPDGRLVIVAAGSTDYHPRRAA